MSVPRLKTHIRVSAHLARVRAGGAFAAIARHGDDDAGAVAVKVYLGGRRARLFVEARDIDGVLGWRELFAGEDETGEDEMSEDARGAGDDAGHDEAKIDAYLEKEAAVDPDLWIIDIEDPKGRAFLDD
ncbi:MAG: DUF1491 family protein [Pseudomonadota bacterium]